MARRVTLVLAMMLAATPIVGLSFTALAGSSLATRLSDLLQRELRLTRGASDLSRALTELDRERASLEYTVAVLDHASSESMRRLDAYRRVRGDRQRTVEARARALYALSRGGISRLVFEDRVDPTAERATDDRITRGRLLSFVVRNDLRELQIHRRAEQRASTELVAASREIQALAAVTMIHAMTEDVLVAADRHFDDALDATTRDRRALQRKASGNALRRNRQLLSLVYDNWRELRELEGLDRAEHLVRPVRGPVVGNFGLYQDRVLRLPMSRNGVELKAVRGERVRALADGRVVLVAELPGFEQVVVVDHGGGQYALLGRLWQVEVTEGQEIRAGDTIARVAPKTLDDGLGTTLYVELRHGEKPIDPTPYLRRTRSGTTPSPTSSQPDVPDELEASAEPAEPDEDPMP